MKLPKVFVFSFIVTFGLAACTISKNNRAYNRVISNPELAEKAFRNGELTHPCITKPVEYRKGKDYIISDTTYDENIDRLNEVIDSLLLQECPVTKTFNLDSLKNRIRRQVEKDCRPVIHYRVDTFLINDERRLQLTKSDLDKSTGANLVLKSNAAAEKDKTSRWKRNFWILVVLIAIGTFLRLKKVI